MQLSSRRSGTFLLAVLCATWMASAASVQVARSNIDAELTSNQLSSRSSANVDTPTSRIVTRHGDHEDGEEQDAQDEHEHEHEHDLTHEMTMPVHPYQFVEAHDEDHEHMPQAAHMDSPHQHEDEHEHEHAHGHGHSHGHDDMQATGPSPASIPDATVAGTELRDLPVWHAHKGHGHSHGSGPALEKLNETSLFRAHGPDPLSYLEWDFGFGLGSASELRRFTTNADVLAGKPKMGVVDGRWRKFLDEQDSEQRQSIAADIASRLPEGQDQEPSRHRGLLVLHVVTAVLSCFVLLPMALVLRAAHSTLAPFVSLLYLAMLGGSMFLSILYKALTPRLYPGNAHGSMGWAILWISLATLGGDVFRLIAQIWSAVSALRSQKQSVNSAWLPTNSAEFSNGTHRSWRDVFGTVLGRQQRPAQNSETYDALEEHAMLSEEAQSDAQELDLEKHMRHRLSSRRSPGSSRAGSGSGSPHRVHFDEHASPATHGASAESLVEPVNWVGSGSTAVSSPRQRGLQMDNVLTTSPTTTACNTPRNSIFGGESASLPLLNGKTFALWSEHTRENHVASPQDGLKDGMPLPTKMRSGRLDTVRTIARYTRVVAARSLPILAFATSYTGLAVYTGSCRGGYKNVCLAHGIKGGIFFWFGLLTFGRYLGAYADCGWAWNKRPSAQAVSAGRGLAAWRRSMPSAEFVECLVIFVYGASNTWMERFGAAPGDPYTIKQIQHISIAVMFWFAGLMGMLLETKTIRNMLSFPIAYHHVAAVPLREARRRRRGHSRRSGEQLSRRGHGEAAADADLDMLVEAQTQPASYSASFNPFPALVIGVTGVAMAAHHQDYQYEVEIHMLWGQLLAGFALLRCLTYFLLWLRPPTASVLPSRPPTEALAAFSLCCGGLVFMLSSEEVSFAAMRSGYGDFMAILNVAVAVVALLFCWTTALMMLKGWAVRREVRRTLTEQQEANEPVRSSSNALQLDVSHAAAATAADEEEEDEERERVPRHMRANVVPGNSQTIETSPVFVLDDDDDDDETGAATHDTFK
ncbi:hypothetical protein EX895_002600 [Sporisorium graminicola]|uniref:Protein YTP1-like C-terminal domain-containing protein n=1 Tax=Sporisorium graminicola TaxID=280036 RepID=A0A4U7KVG2_9BASI|nr:hypothetical protein EX895_002600 [Sporisorium graminicola]TKY88611.1 hypothetical protein EX895_002600 [Sporisorium graminicola]